MDPWKVQRVLKEGIKSLSDSDRVVLERYAEFQRCTAKMASASVQRQFEAAVKLIRGLPKDGPFQPSNDMKLRLYGYFKQATEGPCSEPAPSFWDVIGKAKWGAWKANGNMEPERAMKSYVEEIKQVMETMSLTDDMTCLMDTLGPVYEYVDEAQPSAATTAAPKSAAKKHVRFKTGDTTEEEHVTNTENGTNGHVTPVNGLENGNARVDNGNAIRTQAGAVSTRDSLAFTNGSHISNGFSAAENGASIQNGDSLVPVNGNGALVASAPRVTTMASSPASVTSDTDDEEFQDPIGDSDASDGVTRRRLEVLQSQVAALTRLVDAAGSQMARAVDPEPPTVVAAPAEHADWLVERDQLRALIQDMRADVCRLEGRIAAAEEHRRRALGRPWYAVPELSPRSLLLLLAWPLVVHFALSLIRGRRRAR